MVSYLYLREMWSSKQTKCRTLALGGCRESVLRIWAKTIEFHQGSYKCNSYPLTRDKSNVLASLHMNKNLVFMMSSLIVSMTKRRWLKVLDQMEAIAGKHGGTLSMAKTSWFPEAEQVMCSRALVIDVISELSTTIQPYGLPAFYFLQTWLYRQELLSRFWIRFTQIRFISNAPPFSTSFHLQNPILGQQRRGWVELRWDEWTATIKAKTSVNTFVGSA